ncbi:MAG: leucyl aminopeptidase family protein, partial [Tepidiformaceae bacterium]
MEIRVEAGDITKSAADVLVVNLFEGVTAPAGGTGAVDKALDDAISQLIKLGDIRGKSGELTMIHALGKLAAPRVVVAGLGKQAEFDIDAVRNLSANLARYLRKPGIKTVATICHGAGIAGLDATACAQAIAEGATLGAYRFTRHKSKKDNGDDDRELEWLTIVEQDVAKVDALKVAAARGVLMGAATNAARDMANEPSNHLTPTDIQHKAEDLAAEAGLELTVLDREDMEQKGMGSLLSVARGSAEPPKLLALSYKGKGGEGFDFAFVGKGITFDTGGI